MGTGKGRGFSFWPKLSTWAILVVLKDAGYDKKSALGVKESYGTFISNWLKLFQRKSVTYVLEPLEGHGFWDKKEPFGKLPPKSDYDGKIAVLTRATIRLSKLRSFWQNVGPVSASMDQAEGLINSYGIGEVPWIKQATFSIWENKEAIKNFAYRMQLHKDVIAKTRQQNWYKEDMFVRFKIIEVLEDFN